MEQSDQSGQNAVKLHFLVPKIVWNHSSSTAGMHVINYQCEEFIALSSPLQGLLTLVDDEAAFDFLL